ncbi:Hypothetical protein SMAX5B_000557 [Scophthalmus maximus]|uniref:Uncharacterized protein n=1 Tax=Scophthalmus maximus TaxID=52904 RepID=A0A2U9CKB9_SCOMX|nr:Hypothetical protein SMAX5B_000557 [Scophthalmus maximus]
MPCEHCLLLQRLNRGITNLKTNSSRLLDELKKMDSLLSSFTETALAQTTATALANVA